MGRDIDATEFTREDRLRYRDKVKANLSALRELADHRRFETKERAVGVEMELYLTDTDGKAMPINAEVLERLASEDFQTELAQFNLEFALPPQVLSGPAFRRVEDDLAHSLVRAQEAAGPLGAKVTIIGILPTLSDFDVTERNLSANPRYKALNDAILGARGEDLRIHIEGDETLEVTANSILFEAACTSLQVHVDVGPDDFAAYWNAAQAVAAPLVAVSANSPFFLGKLLHHETRIALFQQATDTRPEELTQQGVRPRVWFGERWLEEGVFELFDENVRYFPALLPICEDEDPHAVLASGGIPRLPELTLHNGTIYRWNRPVYDVMGGKAHLRVENRVLPAGPTVVDATANIAFYCGLLAHFAEPHGQGPIWQRLSFEAAAENFFAAARHGLGAKLYWPGVGAEVPVSELVVRHLVPMAREGLASWGVDEDDVKRLLGIIEARAVTGQNGAVWQIATEQELLRGGMDRTAASAELVRRYQRLSDTGEPVHTWPVGSDVAGS